MADAVRRPAATRHHAAGELINDDSFTIANDVIHVLNEQLLGLQGIGDVVGPGSCGSNRSCTPSICSALAALIGEGATPPFLIIS